MQKNRILCVLSAFGMLLLIQSCAAQSHLIEDKLKTVSTEQLRYYLYYPEDYENTKKDFGLLLFLHGGGESGGELEELKENGPPKMLVEGKQFPFLVLAPQNPHKKKWWNTTAVMQLLDSVVDSNRVDPKRIYLTGLSRGGSASWEMATQYPDKFAAMAVVCGMAPLPYAHWINKKMPIWVFHGANDKVISVEESDKMVAKLRKMNYKVDYTRYENVGHNAWERAYTTDSLYTWFAKQKR
ncbi:prolyl oligopeptidase family serine peptidase [Muricauda sp. 2012CJ35-5]|uniref:Prolyl oligopeptidase family serine peptidase n=1 Tax=Flagellimonas spongiicola TaxID=2942208 RepID=A0ABT0PVT0_9FLAO|nr:PHB depolymerase family esterase [Allomuricauda spongiicola]MCL6275498.1 prolyl oligopeptidase family serine peptidase [Allomuricauda spongiicola]